MTWNLCRKAAKRQGLTLSVHMKGNAMRAVACGLAAALGAASTSVVSAEVVYDATSGRTLNTTFIPDPTSEHAQELTLSAPGTTLTNVELELRNVSSTNPYEGQLTVGLYSSSGALPTALLASRSVAARIDPSAGLTLSVPFDGTLIGGTVVWLSLVIPANTLGGPSIVGIGESVLPPPLAIGSNRGWNTRRAIGDPGWVGTQPPIIGGSAWSVRVNAVPAPSAALLLAAAGVLASKRRR